nr:hypothetical protein BaRGS_021140 [Batillaria attramentaria]
MLGEVTVNVDETQARLTLIEAHQKASDNEMRAENANLTQQVARLNQENINQANQLSQYHLENVNLTNYVHNLQSELTLFHVSQAVEWSPSPADGAVIGACVGQDVTLDWNYTLAQGETVEDIKWFSTDDRSNQMIAFFASGSFGDVRLKIDLYEFPP